MCNLCNLMPDAGSWLHPAVGDGGSNLAADSPPYSASSAYSHLGPKWGGGAKGTSGGTVTWSFALPQTVDKFFHFDQAIGPEFHGAVRSAFAKWASVANLEFVEVADATNVGIRVGFDYIDGRGGFIGTAQYSYSGFSFGSLTAAEIRFETDEGWRFDGSRWVASYGGDFYALALHEIGHAIGLGHVYDPDLIMNWSLGVNLRDLGTGDILGARALYGQPGGRDPATPPDYDGFNYAGIVRGGTAGNEWLSGGFGNDSINGGAGNDTLVGDSGNDQLGGAAGDDVILGSFGNDTAWGEGGNDRLNLGAGQDIALGGEGNDELGMGTGNDIAVGDSGDDVLFGEAGDDRMNGGTGNDTLIGGAGNDELGGGADNDVVIGEDGSDTLFGESGDDSLNGGASADIVLGGDGNDQVGGGRGWDDLQGGSGIDTLWGEAGSDFLTGGAGDDILLGGSEADIFVFGAGHGADTILDFEVRLDRILVQASGYIVVAAGPDTIVHTASGTIGVLGVSAASLTTFDSFLLG